MKKLFTLLMGGVFFLSNSAQAEDLPVAGGWNWSVPMYSCSVTFNNQWSELGLCKALKDNSLPLADYKGVTVYFDEKAIPAADKLQFKVQNATQDGQYSSNDGSETMSITFNADNFGDDQVIIRVNLQAKEAGITAKIDKVVLIKTDGTEVDSECTADWDIAHSWGVTAESTSKVTTFQQWGQLGNWNNTLEEGYAHVYTFTFGGSGVAEGDLQIKYTDDSAIDHFSDVPAGTSFSYEVKETYTNFSLQAKKATEVEILSITREAQAATPPIELDEYKEFPELTPGDVVDLKIIRTFNVGWNTISVPTYLTPLYIKKFFGANVKVYDFIDYSDGKLNFSEMDLVSNPTNWTIDGYKAYLIYITDTDARALTGKFTIYGATVRGNADENGFVVPGGTYDEASNVTFKGTYAPLSGSDLSGSYGVLADGHVKKAGPNAYVGGYHAYFTGIPAAAEAKGVKLVIDGAETTGISQVVAAEEVFGNGAVYNLSGQRVDGKNLAPGIYVRNGKKFMVK